MALAIEDYAMIGDTHTAALVGRDGSIDWLCFPRFDSDACLAALLGRPEHGRWSLAPAESVREVRRRYLPGTLALETEFRTDEGTVQTIDFMPPRGGIADVFRIARGIEGRVRMRHELLVRFGYGRTVPAIDVDGEGDTHVWAGPDALVLRASVDTRVEDGRVVADFTLGEGDEATFAMAWHPAHEAPPKPPEPRSALDDTIAYWEDWCARCAHEGPYAEAVRRSLLTLKALTYAPTGGILAAPTTSLPEALGGVRNWDYRYCWLRDATFTLDALLEAGYAEEARAWRDWLVRAVAGDPAQIQVLYGPAGERRLTEIELPWLPGYEGSRPVRIGNAAESQFQLDVVGELMDSFDHARRAGLEPDASAWSLQKTLLDFLESRWDDPDHGIWEVRGPKRHFTHSKVLAWTALDRAVLAIDRYGLDGPWERWVRPRDEIHADVCRKAFHPGKRAFTQRYGSEDLDASLLLIPIVGLGAGLRDRLGDAERGPFLAADLLAEAFLEVLVAHHVRLGDQEDLQRIELGALPHDAVDAGGEVLEVDERLPVPRFAREEIALELPLVDAGSVLRDRDRVAPVVVDAGDP